MPSWWFVLFSVAICCIKAQTEVYYENNFGACITPDRERGYCVYLDQCSNLYALLQKVPLNDEEKLFLRRSQCGYHEGKVLICCSSKLNTATQVPPLTTNRSPVTLPQPGVCGSGSTDRIYGGNATKIDEFPWMALLQYTKPGNNKGHHCGGVLINERYVLTASHCVNGKAIPTDWRLTAVRLGEWDLSTDQDCEDIDCSDPIQDIPIEQSIPHPDYNPNSKQQYNDIALLRLSRTVRFTDWIKPICLPTANHLRTSSFNGISLDVAGWGKTEVVSASNIKMKARVDGVNQAQCNSVYGRQNINIQSTQICAGGARGVDSCRGDSGGPLIGLDKSNKSVPYNFLVGVVSFGPTPCGLEGWPGVYTRVSAYLDWIESNLRP